jgi:hypothetical protein
MSLLIRAIAPILFIGFHFLLPELAFAETTFATYKNTEHGFSFSYPTDWREAPTRTSQGVVKIASNYGDGDESCNVTLYRSPALKGIPTAKAVRGTTANDLVNELARGGMKNVRAETSGITSVVARDAFFAIISYDIPMAGMTFPIKTLMLITTDSDRVFTISCGTPNVSTFSAMLPLFKFITGTLLIQ